MNDGQLAQTAAVAELPDPRSLWIPLTCIAAFMVAVVTLVTGRIFPGAPHTATIAIGVLGPFLGACVAKTIGVTLRARFA